MSMSGSGSPAARSGRMKRVLDWLTTAYLIRFPLLAGLTLAALPLVAFRTGASQLLENLFDLGVGGAYLVSLTSMLGALSVMVTTRLALLYSDERLDLAPGRISRLLSWREIFLYGMLAVPVQIGILWEAYKLWDYGARGQNWGRVLAILAGNVTALILLWVADRVQKAINAPSTTRRAPDLLMPSSTAEPPASGKSMIVMPGWLASRMKAIPDYLGNGYIDYAADPRQRFPMLPGHGMALSMMGLFLIVYSIVGLVTSPWLTDNRNPSLAGLLLLLTMLNWLLSGLAFFFDRYRIPVAVTIGLLLLLGSTLFPRSDSYYFLTRLEQGASGGAASGQVLGPRQGAKVILVAANGGGIQSAAWTARVLTGIEEACRRSPECGGRSFARSVRLISAVSGGSVGAMYFVNAYQANGELPADPAHLRRIVELAGRSSLDGVAWGMVYPDFLRTAFPFFSELPFFWKTDRGRALEHEWRRDAGLTETLGVWRRDVERGSRPATVFNATIVDTGQPLLFSTIDHPSRHGSSVEFSDLYRGYDLPVTTAVRLSATFPFVTPAARADLGGPSVSQYHVVDGGYYDNYGVSTLIEWLDQALEAAGASVSEVLIVRIHSMPIGGNRSPGGGRGWFYQLAVPLTTLGSVRTAGQLSSGRIQLDLLQRRWQGRTGIQLVTFEYANPDAPLSWHLTVAQKRAIEAEWLRQSEDPNSDLRRVLSFLSK